MSDIDDILKYIAYLDIAGHALIKIGDMLTILLALLLLLATNTGFSIYLLVMRSDEANKVERCQRNFSVDFAIFGKGVGVFFS